MATRSAPLIDPMISSEQVRRRSSLRPKGRVDTIDLLRGIVMVLMLLDHTRDFSHAYSLHFDPTDLQRASVGTFFTRWITHFCAPVFVFLAGTSAYFQKMRGKRTSVLSKQLLTRGAWLILLELTVVRVGIEFNFDLHVVAVLQVMWAIGVSMIVLAGLVRFPTAVSGFAGVLVILSHNVLDRVHGDVWVNAKSVMPLWWEKLWLVIHQPGLIPFDNAGTHLVLVLYPLIPWIAVMAVGYAFGAMYTLEAEDRPLRLVQLGMAVTIMFLILRAINIYGDPNPWMEDQSAGIAVLSFFNVTKYPPSLLYLCMTLGPTFLLLAWFERRRGKKAHNRLERWLITFGRVPLFYYILQWYVAHAIAIVAALIAGQSIGRLFHMPLPGAAGPQDGFPLWMVYLFWLLGLVILYFPCRWYAQFKARGGQWWLSYL